MTKTYLIIAGISGFITVIFGTLINYLLLGKLSPVQLAYFNAALQMQMFHTLAILAIVFFNRYVSRSLLNLAFYLFLSGIVLYSFPVYVNATTSVTGLSMGGFSFLISIGALLFLAGWVAVFWSGVVYVHKKRSHKHD